LRLSVQGNMGASTQIELAESIKLLF